MVLLFYAKESELRRKLSDANLGPVMNLADIPWYVDFNGVRVIFKKIPEIDEVKGVLVELRDLPIEQILINEENPKIVPRRMAGPLKVASELGLSQPKVFLHF